MVACSSARRRWAKSPFLSTLAKAGRSSDSQLPIKSPLLSGSPPAMKASMPPHFSWPSTTMCFTCSACTANSTAAEAPWYLPEVS